MPTTLSDEWLTPTQAANQLQRSPQRVRQLGAAGKLRALTTPLGHLVAASDVAAMLAAREAPPPEDAR